MRMIIIVTGFLGGWFVMTFNGQTIAGPFDLLSDCNRVAEAMAKVDPQVSQICEAR